MTLRTAVALSRAIERGADRMSLLMAYEARERRKAVRPLYTPVPKPVESAYRAIEREEQKTAEKTRVETMRAELIRAAMVLNDPEASDEDKLLARIESVHAPFPANYAEFLDSKSEEEQ